MDKADRTNSNSIPKAYLHTDRWEVWERFGFKRKGGGGGTNVFYFL